MIEAGSIELTQARVLARHGERLTAADWRRIEAMRDWAPALELARATALRPWLEGITADSGVVAIEAALRRHWRGVVDEVAAWMPRAWQPAEYSRRWPFGLLQWETVSRRSVSNAARAAPDAIDRAPNATPSRRSPARAATISAAAAFSSTVSRYGPVAP